VSPRPARMTRRQLAALGVTRVVPHRPSFVGPKSLLAKATKAKRARKHTEHDEQAALFAWVDADGIALFDELRDLYAVPNETGWLNPAQRAKSQREGRRPGVLDLALDHARGGFFGFRGEMKSKTGRISTWQRGRMKRLLAAGYYVALARSCDEMRDYLLGYLAWPRTIAHAWTV